MFWPFWAVEHYPLAHRGLREGTNLDVREVLLHAWVAGVKNSMFVYRFRSTDSGHSRTPCASMGGLVCC